jgi:hypothetical protein
MNVRSVTLVVELDNVLQQEGGRFLSVQQALRVSAALFKLDLLGTQRPAFIVELQNWLSLFQLVLPLGKHLLVPREYIVGYLICSHMGQKVTENKFQIFVTYLSNIQ